MESKRQKMMAITLEPSDYKEHEEKITVDYDVIKLSGLIKQLMDSYEDLDHDENETIPLPNVTHKILVLVVNWCT